MYIFAASQDKCNEYFIRKQKHNALKNIKLLIVSLVVFLAITPPLQAQTVEDFGSRITVYAIILALVVLLIFIGLPLYAWYKPKSRFRNKTFRYSSPLLPLVPPSLPSYVKGKKVHILKGGHDIWLTGVPQGKLLDRTVKTYALQPTEFRGMFPIPKVLVQVGDRVKAGQIVYHDREKTEINYAAPVSGEVLAINRGAKRSIVEIVIAADNTIEYLPLNPPSPESCSREELVEFLLSCGAWPLFNQRPYDIIPDKDTVPRDIFISTFNTAPLSCDNNIAVNGNGPAFQQGLDVLTKLTSGQVHLGLNANAKDAPADEFLNAKNVEKHWFHGKHPTGNVGVQIHHVRPLGLRDVVWTLTVQQVIQLGKIFTEKKWVADRVVAVGGSSVHETGYVRTKTGANIGELFGEVDNGARLISGDVLSGSQKLKRNFLNWRDEMATAIPEGTYNEFFGWFIPSVAAPSASRTYANYFFPKKQFDGDTNKHGEKRAFVMTDDYDNMLPMDIHLLHLMKSVVVNDYDGMEGLGLKELSEEDVALAEWRCTSKQPLQQIVRKGLDMLREQEM